MRIVCGWQCCRSRAHNVCCTIVVVALSSAAFPALARKGQHVSRAGAEGSLGGVPRGLRSGDYER